MTWWYLVYIVSGQFIGPLPEQHCRAASDERAGLVCIQPCYLYACEVAGRPGTYTNCPMFDLPRISAK
jgi:hypothetical protein